MARFSAATRQLLVLLFALLVNVAPWSWLGVSGDAQRCLLAADWTTYRGNPQRTGNVDGQSGPKAPRVLWALKSTDHYLAAPVVTDGLAFVSGLGAFNSASFQALDIDPKKNPRLRWGKGAPFLKLPTVCSPATANGLVIFGDGMHQTDGAMLHGLRIDNGMPVWQFPIPGQLVHLEGGPAIAGNRVFFGAGNAGVLCLDTSKLELDGKEIDFAAAQVQLKKQWDMMVAKYEQEKKVDPDFAIPPSEDALPKPRPKKAWQQGAGQWHVDAPLAVTNDFVLVASARLDLEKTGDRALLALKVSDGSTAWKQPLTHNPWAGATVAGDLVLVGSSNIRLEPKDIPQGKGELAAFQLATGAAKWKRELPGGVVSSVAVKGSTAVVVATDGKVRGIDVATGQDRWTYDAQAPFFAAPAIAGEAIYAADLRGVIHCLLVSDGKLLWKFDVGQDPAVGAPGQIYGAPAIAGGKLYVATCNLETTAERRPTAVICIGD
ncbi:MAG: PQQ-binding-like beta-propeller repeat protein [Planctomycetota bacterium]